MSNMMIKTEIVLQYIPFGGSNWADLKEFPTASQAFRGIGQNEEMWKAAEALMDNPEGAVGRPKEYRVIERQIREQVIER